MQSIVHAWSEAAATQQARLKEAHVAFDQRIDERLATSEASAAEQLAVSEQRVLASHERLSNSIDKRLQSTVQGWQEATATQEAHFKEAYLALDKRVEERMTASNANTLGKFSALEALLLELDTKFASIVASQARIAEDAERQRKALQISWAAHILGGIAITTLFLWIIIARPAQFH
jgi:hypothetical protein